MKTKNKKVLLVVSLLLSLLLLLYGPSEKWVGARESWCYERVGWLSKAVCVEVEHMERMEED